MCFFGNEWMQDWKEPKPLSTRTHTQMLIDILWPMCTCKISCEQYFWILQALALICYMPPSLILTLISHCWGSPYLFGQTLASTLLSLSLPKSKLMQYVDDLLICSPSPQISQDDTSALPNFLSNWGYRVSSSVVQLSTPQVTYLELMNTPNYKARTLDTKHQIQSLIVLFTKEEILIFLGISGFLRS